MISGTDIVIPCSPQKKDYNYLWYLVRTYWPWAWIVDEHSIQDRELLSLPVISSEMHCYENEEAFNSWTEFGWTEENGPQHISIYFDIDQVTLVAEKYNEMIDKIVSLN
jgi:hypothetical protein